MMNKIFTSPLTVFIVLFTIGLFVPKQVIAHCDGLDGPVVKAAHKAL